jgi:hypothetical protein
MQKFGQRIDLWRVRSSLRTAIPVIGWGKNTHSNTYIDQSRIPAARHTATRIDTRGPVRSRSYRFEDDRQMIAALRIIFGPSLYRVLVLVREDRKASRLRFQSEKLVSR